MPIFRILLYLLLDVNGGKLLILLGIHLAYTQHGRGQQACDHKNEKYQ